MRDLQKEVHWHQESTSSKKQGGNLLAKDTASTRSGAGKTTLNTQQRALHSAKDKQPNQVRGKGLDENACRNAGSAGNNQIPSLTTAKAIQMAVDCQNGRWGCFQRGCVGNQLVNDCRSSSLLTEALSFTTRSPMLPIAESDLDKVPLAPFLCNATMTPDIGQHLLCC